MIVDLENIVIGSLKKYSFKTLLNISNYQFEVNLRKNYNDTPLLIKTVTNGTITPDSDGYYNSLPIYIKDTDYDTLYAGDWYINMIYYDVTNEPIRFIDSQLIKILI